MPKISAWLWLAGLLNFVCASPALAQCQTAPLALGTELVGALTSADCTVTPLRNAPGEHWTVSLAAGDFTAVTMRRQTILDPYLYVLDPTGTIVAENDGNAGSLISFGDARVTFTAGTTGDYTVVATTWFRLPFTDYGLYSIRAERVTTPLASELTSTVTGSQVVIRWTRATSPTPILEYVLEVGSGAGLKDIGVFSMGTASEVFASAGTGVYYVRLRARNATGVGAASPEIVVTVGAELSPPRSLTANVVGRRVTLTWFSPTTPGATYYELLVGTGPGLTDMGTFVVGLVTSVSVENVPPGAYYVRVRAGNARGPGDASSEVIVIVF